MQINAKCIKSTPNFTSIMFRTLIGQTRLCLVYMAFARAAVFRFGVVTSTSTDSDVKFVVTKLHTVRPFGPRAPATWHLSKNILRISALYEIILYRRDIARP